MTRVAPRALAFTLIEMMTTVAALVILLGLMVSLARYVRNESAKELTRDVLWKIDRLMEQYMARNGGHPPVVAAFIPAAEPESGEQSLDKTAWQNNRQFLAALRTETRITADAFEGLPESIYDDLTLRDAWGNPIIFMPAMHPAIGMAPHNKPFFFSAGPDRRFLTQEDNLYSYEEQKTNAER